MFAPTSRFEQFLDEEQDIFFLESYARLAFLDEKVSLPRAAMLAGMSIKHIPLHLHSHHAITAAILEYAESRLAKLVSNRTPYRDPSCAFEELCDELVSMAERLPWLWLYALRPEGQTAPPGLSFDLLLTHLRSLYEDMRKRRHVNREIDAHLAAVIFLDVFRLRLLESCIFGHRLSREALHNQINLVRTSPSNGGRPRALAPADEEVNAMEKTSQRKQDVPGTSLSVIRGGAGVREEPPLKRIEPRYRRGSSRYAFPARRRKQRLTMPRSASVHPLVLSLAVMVAVSLLFLTLYLLR